MAGRFSAAEYNVADIWVSYNVTDYLLQPYVFRLKHSRKGSPGVYGRYNQFIQIGRYGEVKGV